MSTRLALLVAALAIYGCATEPEQQKAAAPAPASTAAPAAAAAPAPYQHKGPTYRTGSRLPPTDDDGGSSTVGGVSRDDYMNDRNSSVSPTRGN
jgi:hypothetical protein